MPAGRLTQAGARPCGNRPARARRAGGGCKSGGRCTGRACPASRRGWRTSGAASLDADQRGFGSFRPEGAVRGRALVAHELAALLLPPGAPAPVWHNNLGEAVAMRDTLLGLGFAVDVISRERRRFRPRHRYDLFVGARQNFTRIAAALDPGCIKVAHLDTAHWLASNAAVLRPRGGAARPPRRRARQPQVHRHQPGDRGRRLCDAPRQRLRLRDLRLRRQAGVPGAEPGGGHLPLPRGQGLRRGAPPLPLDRQPGLRAQGPRPGARGLRADARATI